MWRAIQLWTCSATWGLGSVSILTSSGNFVMGNSPVCEIVTKGLDDRDGMRSGSGLEEKKYGSGLQTKLES